jgi:hypothetical protein
LETRKKKKKSIAPLHDSFSKHDTHNDRFLYASGRGGDWFLLASLSWREKGQRYPENVFVLEISRTG